jgi:hypothetical protein
VKARVILKNRLRRKICIHRITNQAGLQLTQASVIDSSTTNHLLPTEIRLHDHVKSKAIPETGREGL